LTTDRLPTTDDRPQGPFTHFGKISNGHNSATRQPIPFMFGSRVGFWGMADRTAPFPVGSNSRWRPAAILKTSNGHISATHYPVHCMYVLCTRSLMYNDGDSKLISQGMVSSRPTVKRERTKKKVLRNSRGNNARGVDIRLVTV